VGATVRSRAEPIVEIESLDGRRFRYAPVADIRVVAGELVSAGAVLGRVAGNHAAYLELAVRDPDGRWVDPYPLLVGLADPNELGVDNRTGAGVDPDVTRQTDPTSVADSTAPGPASAPAAAEIDAPVTAPPIAGAPASTFAGFPAPVVPFAAFPPPTGPPVTPVVDESVTNTADETVVTPSTAGEVAADPAPSPWLAETPVAPRVSSDILAAMIAPTPAPQPERTDD
jgi:hypothetical protein